MGMDLAYAAAVLAASCITAKRDGWILFPLLPLVFSVYHFAYGLGFLSGIFYFSTKPRTASYSESVFTELTR
jgi:hypothetical protein